MFYTKNRINFGTENSLPYITLLEAIFLIENDHCDTQRLYRAIENSVLFRFPDVKEQEIISDLSQLESQIQMRYRAYLGSNMVFRCDSVMANINNGCSCGTLDPILIIGQRLNGHFEETVVRCSACREKFQLPQQQAYLLRASILRKYSDDKSISLNELRRFIMRIRPSSKFASSWKVQDAYWNDILDVA